MEIMVIPPSFHISLQQLGTALQKSAGVFCSLIRSHLAKKKIKKTDVKRTMKWKKKKFKKEKFKSHDRVEKSTLAAKRLKNLAGNTQNIIVSSVFFHLET